MAGITIPSDEPTLEDVIYGYKCSCGKHRVHSVYYVRNDQEQLIETHTRVLCVGKAIKQ